MDYSAIIIPTLIAAIGVLYSVYKRTIDRRNSLINERRKQAAIILNNAERWSNLLMKTFHDAIASARQGDFQSALNTINCLVDDFYHVHYESLKHDNIIIKNLRNSPGFTNYAYECSQFYESAIDVKRMVYNEIKIGPNNQASLVLAAKEHSSDLFNDVVTSYSHEVSDMLRRIRKAYDELNLIAPM